MKIAFIWYFDRASQIKPNWRDGLRSALELIGKSHQVDWYLDKQVPEKDDHDIILFWDDSNSSFFNELDKYPKAKKGIFLTTNPQNMDNLRKLDAVFCESKPVLNEVLEGGAKGILAFGTDTDFYKPDYSKVKDIEFFYPSTFSPWKRQSRIAYLGERLLVIGTLQPDGVEELEACERNRVRRILGYLPAEEIRDYYQRAENVIIPATHGSERTVIEAMSTNILPIVTEKNIKACSYVKDFIDGSHGSPRDFVLQKYSHRVYADAILGAFK